MSQTTIDHPWLCPGPQFTYNLGYSLLFWPLTVIHYLYMNFLICTLVKRAETPALGVRVRTLEVMSENSEDTI